MVCGELEVPAYQKAHSRVPRHPQSLLHSSVSIQRRHLLPICSSSGLIRCKSNYLQRHLKPSLLRTGPVAICKTAGLECTMTGLSQGLLPEGSQGGAHADVFARLSKPDAYRHLTLADI